MSKEPSERRIVPDLRSRLNAQLDELLGAYGLPDLADAADAVEELARSALTEGLLDNSGSLFGLREGTSHSIFVDHAHTSYRIVVCDDVSDPRILTIAVTPTDLHSPRTPMQVRTFKIAGSGQVSKVRLHAATSVTVDAHLLQDMVLAIFETSYSWFKDRVEFLLSKQAVEVSDTLYRQLFRLFPRPEARANLWLACVTEDKGYRLLDHSLARQSFDLVDTGNQTVFSTNRLVAELLTTWLPRSKLLMQLAVVQRRCIDVSLSEAAYTKEGSLYAAALRALYGSDAFSIYPILTSERIAVVALFPAPLRATIEPILDAHREDLAGVCSRTLSPIARTYDLIARGGKRRVNWGKVGELVGGFTKEFFKAN